MEETKFSENSCTLCVGFVEKTSNNKQVQFSVLYERVHGRYDLS